MIEVRHQREVDVEREQNVGLNAQLHASQSLLEQQALKLHVGVELNSGQHAQVTVTFMFSFQR